MDSQIQTEQQIEQFLRTFPHMMWSYYYKLKGKGFSEGQAFQLVRDFQSATIMKPSPIDPLADYGDD